MRNDLIGEHEIKREMRLAMFLKPGAVPENAMSDSRNLDVQMDMFERKGMKRVDALKYYIIPRKDGTFLLRKRSEPLEVGDMDVRGNSTVVRKVSNFMYSNAIGINRSKRRGKYNDENKILGQEHGELSTGEVVAVAVI